MPWGIINKEKFNNFVDARKREKYLKSAVGRKYLKKLFNEINETN